MSTATPSPSRQSRLAWIIAEREISTKLRSKAFIISNAILALVILAAVIVLGIVQQQNAAKQPEAVPVAVVGAEVPLPAAQFDAQQVQDRAAAEKLVESGDVDAAVIPGKTEGAPVTVVAEDEAPDALVSALTVAPKVELLSGSAGDDFNMLAYFAAIGFGVVFMTSAITFGTTIAQSVVEEKQTRIVEILLATVKSTTLMAGKILGNSVLALGTVVTIIALAAVGMLATGQDLLLGELGLSLLWFGILFAFGFVLIATLYASAAALVSRQEDIGSVTSPVMMIVMIPYFLVIFFNDDPKVLAIMSYIPFSAPVGMPMRLVLGTAEWWEPVLSLGIILVTIALMIWAAARVYRGAILRTGSRVKLAEALKG